MPGKTNPSRNSAAVEDYLERILELINSKRPYLDRSR